MIELTSMHHIVLTVPILMTFYP